jgi:hypothetical protein
VSRPHNNRPKTPSKRTRRQCLVCSRMNTTLALTSGPFDFGLLVQLSRGNSGSVIDIPCPLCGPHCSTAANRRSKKLRIWWKSADFVSFKCVRCNARGWAKADRAAGYRPPVCPSAEVELQRKTADENKRQRRALELFDQARSIIDSRVMRYFERRRIHNLPPDFHAVLRYHPHCPFGKNAPPQACLLTLLRHVVSNEPRAMQRTALTIDGEKIGRRTLGPKLGAACKLWPDDYVTSGLVVTEGVETALAAASFEHKGTLLHPCWALIDAENVELFQVLPGVESLTLIVDHDAPTPQYPFGRGQTAAANCAMRWRRAGHEVIKLTPTQIETDFADLLAKEVTP